MKITGKNVKDTLFQRFKADAQLLKDVAEFFAFSAAITADDPIGYAAGAALITKTAGSALSAGTNIISRLSEEGTESIEDPLQPYDRFRVLFYVTCQRCFIESIDQEFSSNSDKPLIKTDFRKLEEIDLKNIKRVLTLDVANLYEAELTFLFCIEPLSGSVPLYSAFSKLTETSLVYHGFSISDAKKTAEKIEKDARKRFQVFLAKKDDTSEWLRNFLAITTSQETSQRVVSDLSAIRETLNNWTDSASPLKQSQKDSWDSYRNMLRTLPDQKETMFNENFGVRKVFIQPKALYQIRTSESLQQKPHPVPDLGRLIGALISSRVNGEDLIILSGGPGSGKSTLCRSITSELASNPEIHPVFLRLRRVKEGADIGHFIEESLQKQGLINRMADLREIPNLVLILDGFDELVMASRSRLRHFFNVLREDLSLGPLRNAKAIISGRDTLFPKGEGLPIGSHVISLQPFDKSQIKGWGAKWRQLHKSGPGKNFRPEGFVSNTDNDGRRSPLHHLVSWPLTLHLVARVHTSGRLEISGKAAKRIEKAYLYRSILAETSSRQSEQAEGSGRLDTKTMRSFLRELGWEMYIRSADSMDLSDVIPTLKSHSVNQSEIDLAELAEVAVVNCPELTKGEETGFEFVHKSFSEYLVAERLAELIERVVFMSPDFGGDLTWRMSEQEAARELAPSLAVRVIPEEVQEMFEPMLGCFGPFSKGDLVDDAANVEIRREGLERIIQRFEALYSAFLKGELYDAVDKISPNALSRSPFEAQANFCAGILIIGSSAARQLRQFGNRKESPRTFNGEPFKGAFWKAVCILSTGGVTLDEKLSERILDGISLSVADDSSPVDDFESPLKFGYFHFAAGYQQTLTRHIEESLEFVSELERLINFTQVALRELSRVDRLNPKIALGFSDFTVHHPRISSDPIRELALKLFHHGLIHERVLASVNDFDIVNSDFFSLHSGSQVKEYFHEAFSGHWWDARKGSVSGAVEELRKVIALTLNSMVHAESKASDEM